MYVSFPPSEWIPMDKLTKKSAEIVTLWEPIINKNGLKRYAELKDICAEHEFSQQEAWKAFMELQELELAIVLP